MSQEAVEYAVRPEAQTEAIGERYVVVDLETTDREPEKAHIVEWALVAVVPQFFNLPAAPSCYSGLVKPPVPIPAETSAIHHIVDADVADALPWEHAQRIVVDMLDDPAVIAVAHNANYERTVLASLNLRCKWLCTYKAALRLWPDAPGHSNETLRYWRGLGTGRSDRQEPHSAMHDAIVTAQLLGELLKAGTSPADMIKWADEPALLPRCPLGDWRGSPWADVDEGFLLWILRKITDREDVRFCARMELDRRHNAVNEQRAALRRAANVDDEIPF